jgi:hemerythrin superfamily protein
MRALFRLSRIASILNKNLIKLNLYRSFAQQNKDNQSNKDTQGSYSSKIDEKQQSQQNQNKQQQSQGQSDKLDEKDKTVSDMSTGAKESLRSMNKPIEELIVADHKDIMSFYHEFDKTSKEEDALKWLRQFIWELARHSIAEELILYPVYKGKIPQGESYWNKSMEEHRKIKVLLSEIESTSDISKIRSKMKEVIDSLNRHTDMEENEILPLVKKHVSEAERISYGNTFLRRKLIVPTRPHPSVPDSIPTIQSLVGLLVAPIDKFRDVIFSNFPDQDTVNRIKEQNVNK